MGGWRTRSKAYVANFTSSPAKLDERESDDKTTKGEKKIATENLNNKIILHPTPPSVTPLPPCFFPHCGSEKLKSRYFSRRFPVSTPQTWNAKSYVNVVFDSV